MSWQEGYVTEVSYTYGYYSHLSPVQIELALLYNGIAAPNWREPFKYCELACGHGMTSIALAALYPWGEFYATDFNPNHIAEAQKLVAAIGLGNVHFSDHSFQEYLNDTTLPMFDYISLHGIYSWISPQNRAYIRQFIKNRLNVGGVVSISYNVLPGWNAFAPIQHLIDRYQRHEVVGNVFHRFDKSLEFLKQIQENKAVFFDPQMNARIENIFKNSNKSYLVHEYFNNDWHPMYSDQVIEEMDEIKLSYAGSAMLLENIYSFSLTIEACNHIKGMACAKTRELLKDFYTNCTFRRDIYIRGKLNLSYARSTEILNSINVIPLVHRGDIKLTLSQGMLANVQLIPELHYEFFDLIVAGHYNLCDLFRELEQKGYSYNQFFTALFAFIGLNYIHPIYEVENSATTSSFNSLVWNNLYHDIGFKYFVAPQLGTAFWLEFFDYTFLKWEELGATGSLLDFVLLSLKRQNLLLANDEGKCLEKRGEQENLILEKYTKFTDQRLQMFKKVGITRFLDKNGTS